MKYLKQAAPDAKSLITSPRFTTTLFLGIIILVLFNFNFDVFKAGAAPGPILGEGSAGFIPKWIDPSAQPDLTSLVAPTINGAASVGATVTFTGTANNIGFASAVGVFSNRFQVDVGADSVWDTNLDAIDSITGLIAGGSDTATSPTYTFAVAGDYTIRFCADLPPTPSGVIVESDEGNNCNALATYLSFTVGTGYDFRIEPLGQVDIQPTDSQNVQVLLTKLSATGDEIVELSFSGLPAGVSVAPSTYSCTPNCANTFVVTTSGVTPGTYTITITGLSGSGVSRTEQFDLHVAFVCSDGIDNDGDGDIDFPADAGCDDSTDNTEGSATAVLTLTADGKAPVIRVISETTAQIEWSTTDVTVGSCTVSGTNGDSWSGETGGETSSIITGPVIYTLTCLDLEGATVSTTINVLLLPDFEEF